MNQNKTFIHLFTVLLLGFSIFQAACKKEQNEGAPVITSLRAITPAPNDSTLTKVLPGQTVVVRGSGLKNTVNVSFNGYPAAFNSALTTDNSLIVTIPGDMPFATLNPQDMNKIRVTTTSGEVIYDFPVVPPPAVVSSVNYEFASPGETITMKGQYLYLIKKIIFPGNKEATEFEGSNDGLTARVKVPAGANLAGSITLITQGGSTSTSTSGVTWHDESAVFYNFDDKNAFSPWGALPVLADAAPNITAYSGKFLYWYNKNVTSGTWWCQDLATPSDASKLAYPSTIPDNEPIANLALKFEINVPGDGLKDGVIDFKFTDDHAVSWSPASQGTLKTNGWQTVSIPLESLSGNPGTYKTIKGLAFNVFYNNGKGKQATDVIMGWDNFRIVKIK